MYFGIFDSLISLVRLCLQSFADLWQHFGTPTAYFEIKQKVNEIVMKYFINIYIFCILKRLSKNRCRSQNISYFIVV